MKKPAPLKSRFHVTVPQEVMRQILKSDQTPQVWLREAAQQRLAKEHHEEPPLERMERLLTIAQQHIDALTLELQNVKVEIGKSHATQARATSELTGLAQTAGAVYKNQHDLANLVLRMDNNLGHTVEKMGPSLLVVLSDKLRDLIQLEMAKESKPKPRPPIPPRTGL